MNLHLKLRRFPFYPLNYEDVEKDASALYYDSATEINRAHGIAVTHVYGIDEFGVQLPVGPLDLNNPL